jgi:ribosomal protein S18 acetylase RimI-like enzyme
MKKKNIQNNSIVREATLGDTDAIVDLLQILFTQEADFQPDARKQRNGVSKVILNPAIGTILVAEMGGSLIGSVHVALVHSTVEGDTVANIEDFVVHPDHRGGGIGRMLMNSAFQYIRNKGISRVTLLTDADNERAIRFYRDNGFEQSKMVPLRRYL